jgi:S1-C subfamily serine protease
MRLRLKLLIYGLVSSFLLAFFWIGCDIVKDIQYNKKIIQEESQLNDKIIIRILSELQVLDAKNKNTTILIDEIYDNLIKQIENIPEKERLIKTNIEYKLRQAVVIIYNKTDGALGSGVTIKYKDKFYILSAGHMADVDEDILTFGENGKEVGELKIIKHSFTTSEEYEKNGDLTKGNDLILLQPKNKDLIPKFYVELADTEIQAPNEIYVVGNPVGIEDVLCEGRIIKYINNFVYYINHTYFGNSGGGVFTEDGKLLGIVSHMYPISLNPGIPPYMTYGAVRLSAIQDFLKDVM